MNRDTLILASRADFIPEAESGLWNVRRIHYPKIHLSELYEGGLWNHFTILGRWTNSSIMQDMPSTVMSDNLGELVKHLEPAMSARGSVFVAGLGLGCVLRMLQNNPNVTSITLLENSRDVVDMVWPHTSHDRVELVEACALEYLRSTSRTWDYAWHDVWTDEDAGQESLASFHQRLMAECIDRVRWQGAWAFPRVQRRAFENMAREYPADDIRAAFRIHVSEADECCDS